MRKVYAISSGSYSDYTVHAIFEREEDAEAFNKSCLDGEEYCGSYEIEEMHFYAEGEKPEAEVWYSGHMTVNDKEPTIRENSRWPWENYYTMPPEDRPKVYFSGYNKVPEFRGQCFDRGQLERALREKTLKYRAELDQLMRDVYGTLVRLAGERNRPVMVEEISAIVGRDVSVVAWAVQELKNMGCLADAPQARPVKREEMEPPEPGQAVRIPIKAGLRPPKPEQISGDGKGTDGGDS